MVSSTSEVVPSAQVPATREANVTGQVTNGFLGKKCVRVITALTLAAILVIACLGISGSLSGVVVGASIAGMSAGLFALHALATRKNAPEGQKNILKSWHGKVLLGVCAYAALFGILGATGVLSASVVGWVIVASSIAAIGPYAICCACCCAYVPCYGATALALSGSRAEPLSEAQRNELAEFDLENFPTQLRPLVRHFAEAFVRIGT